jgi:antirestriction protein ArdC
MRDTYGSCGYAFEELVAEFTCAFLCVHFGIEERDTDYIEYWVMLLRGDEKAVTKSMTRNS